jgi:hypothetical protein
VFSYLSSLQKVLVSTSIQYSRDAVVSRIAALNGYVSSVSTLKKLGSVTASTSTDSAAAATAALLIF